MAPLTIYGMARSRASRILWLCEELGIAYRLVPVMQAYRLPDPAAPDAPFNTQSPDFLRLNPSGLIPVVDDDGLVLTESLAINLYLARKHGGPVAGADLAEEGRIAMWTLWAATGVEPHAIEILFHRALRPPEAREPARAEAGVAALRGPMGVLEDALAQNAGWLVGGRFTLADLHVVEVLRYAFPAPELFEDRPAIRAWIAACHARPAFQRMMALREAEPA